MYPHLAQSKYGLHSVEVRLGRGSGIGFLVSLIVHCPKSKTFTQQFVRADVYELIAPDILHQVVKGVFKDHIVTWNETYLENLADKKLGKAISSEIDLRYVRKSSLTRKCWLSTGI